MTSGYSVLVGLDVGWGNHHAAGLDPTGEATARRVTAKQPTQAADGRCSNYVLGEFCGGAPAFAKWRLPWRSAV